MQARRWWLTLVLTTAMPMVFLAGLLLGSDHLAGISPEAAPVLAPVSRLELTDERRAVVVLSWEQGLPLPAPNWSGLITAVHVAPGHELRTGDPVVTVDGVARLAAALDEPVFRSLRRGDRGRDVGMLHGLLADLGLLDEPPPDDDRFGAATERAVRELGRMIGATQPTGVFDPGWLVWLPFEPWPVEEVTLRVGQAAPPQGEVVGFGRPQLAAVEIVNADFGPLELDPDVAWMLTLDGQRFPLAGAVLPDAHLAALEELTDSGAEAATGLVHRAQPLEVVVVPATAVMTGHDGRLCVWSPRGPTFVSTDVEVVGARAGVSHLAPQEAMPGEVLANPSEVLEDLTCPSS